MPEEAELRPSIPVQIRLDHKEGKRTYFILTKDIGVWPSGGGGRGFLDSDVQVERIEKKRIRGLQAWNAGKEVTVHFGKKHWTIGPEFGAHAGSAKKRTVTL